MMNSACPPMPGRRPGNQDYLPAMLRIALQAG